MNRMGDRNAAFRLQRVEVPMVLQPEGRVPESRFMGRENLQNLDATRGHEPEMRKLFTINGRIFRFMGSALADNDGLGEKFDQ